MFEFLVSFAKYNQLLQLKKLSATVFKAPTCPPILINRNISRAGRAIKI